MQTLPDFIDDRLQLLSIGLNPSLPAVEAGYYFANPRNRFWRAFFASKLVEQSLQLEPAIHLRLLREYRIGFTDVAKRPTRMGKALRAADFKKDAPALKAKIEQHQPKICWFHGKQAIQYYLRYADQSRRSKGSEIPVDWGWQSWSIAASKVFVSPNPSPANAAYSLEDIVESYRMLRLAV